MTEEATPTAQYSITMRIEYPHEPGWIAKIAGTIAEHGGSIRAIDFVHIHGNHSIRDYSIECVSTQQARKIIESVKAIAGVEFHSVSDDTFLMHLGGKLEIASKVPLKTRADLSMAYTPGVARVCKAIQAEPRASFSLTIRKNCIAIVTDGSAVLGLGNIGARAAMPVMEGKAILFKEFGSVDAFPICLDTQDTEAIIAACHALQPTFGGINLEDISAPRCFTIERELQRTMEIPVFHDDQHGTAVVVLAAAINALKITGRVPADMKLVVSGAGAAGWACTKILKSLGIGNIVVCDSGGTIRKGRDVGNNPAKIWFQENTNLEGETGGLKDAIRGADMFLGVSRPGLLERSDVEGMRPSPIIFAMANPTPEVMPEEVEGVAGIMATGRSDYPNQINNVLAFPGIFRGALDARATSINEEMQFEAADAIAGVVTDKELSADYIIPSVFNHKVVRDVARAVSRAAHQTKVAQRIPKGTNLYP